MIVNILRVSTQNAGDLSASPLKNLAIPGWLVESIEQDLLKKAELIIVGGGGMLNYKKWDNVIGYLSDNHPDKTVIWGAGSNKHDGDDTDRDLSVFKLVGVRDYGENYLPCASCLRPELDLKRTNKGGIGLIENNAAYGNKIAELDAEHEKLLTRGKSFREIVEFILSKDLIVTNSYHCVYWSNLLEVPVVGIRTTSKFDHFRYPVPITGYQSWTHHIGYDTTFKGALKEARELNMAFIKKVEKHFPVFKQRG